MPDSHDGPQGPPPDPMFDEKAIGVDGPTLIRFVAGELTGIEEAQIGSTLRATAAGRAWLQAIRTLWRASADVAAVPDVDPKPAWDRLRAELGPVGAPSRDAISAQDTPQRRGDWRDQGARSRQIPFHEGTGVGTTPHRWPRGVGDGRRWATIQASAALILLSAGVATLWSIRTVSVRRQPVHELATAAAARASITLRDGTRLTLGPATRVRVPADFGRTTRTVELEGEAYFAVVHDEHHPFVVHARNATVTDIGTGFDIRAYAGDAVRVAVAEGRVSLARKGGRDARGEAETPKSLARGDLASVTDTAIVVTHGADIAALTAWTQGRLVFEDTPLPDVARQLDRAFNVEITIADSALAGREVSGVFDNETVDQVLDAVTAVIGGRYERSGRAVVIRRGMAGARRPRHTAQTPLTTVEANREPHE